jgi:hypothetical protein
MVDPIWIGTPTFGLLLAAEFGALARAQRRRLEAAGVDVHDREFTSELELLNHVFGSAMLRETMPWEIAERGLAWFRSRPLTADRLCLVAGDSPWDFSLAYAIRRAHLHAFWVPEGALGAHAAWAVDKLARAAVRSALPLVVTSASDDVAALELGERLSAAGATPAVVPWREVLPRRPNRLRLFGSLGLPSNVLLDELAMTPPLPTPIPDVEPSDVRQLRWMTEVDVQSWCALRHPDVGDALVASSAGRAARATTDGVAYFCPGWAVQGNVPLEQQTSRPVLQVQSLLDQFRAAGAPQGWTCELSDKGAFTIAAAERFGGLSELADAISTPAIAAALLAFLDGADEVPGLKLSDRRRYLSAEDMRVVSNCTGPDALEALLAAKAVARGLVLKCARCRHTSWYRLRDVDPGFECHRCAHEQALGPHATLGRIDPPLFYRLDEAVFQFLRHRGDLALLAAADLYQGEELPNLVVPELTLCHQAGLELEVDYIVVAGGDLDIGEAFTSDRYAKTGEHTRLSELARAAEAFNARNVTICTAALALHSKTRGRLEAAIPGPWPRHRVVSGARMLPRPLKLVDDLP